MPRLFSAQNLSTSEAVTHSLNDGCFQANILAVFAFSTSFVQLRFIWDLSCWSAVSRGHLAPILVCSSNVWHSQFDSFGSVERPAIQCSTSAHFPNAAPPKNAFLRDQQSPGLIGFHPYHKSSPPFSADVVLDLHECYPTFIMLMGRSRFRVCLQYWFGPSDSVSYVQLHALTPAKLPAPALSRTARESHARLGSLSLVNRCTVSGSLSLPSPGVLFTFPSRYYAYRSSKEYLLFNDGCPDFPKVSRVSWYFVLHSLCFPITGTVHLLLVEAVNTVLVTLI